MPFIPLTPEEERHALAVIGVQSVDDLFAAIPPRIREEADFSLDLGAESNRGLTEPELRAYFSRLASIEREHGGAIRHFLGGGTYETLVPAAVDHLALRSEFLTAPAPQNAARSQGILRVLWELEQMVCLVVGRGTATVSLHDGATAAAEAALLAKRVAIGKGQRILAAATLPTAVRATLATFTRAHPPSAETVGMTAQGTLDLSSLAQLCEGEAPAALLVATPNALGIMEPVGKIREALPESTLLIVSMTDATAPALFESPGTLGADIVTGDLQPFASSPSFGGARAGFLAVNDKLRDEMPGWRVEGESGILKAVVAANQKNPAPLFGPGLNSLRAAFSLSLLGKRGFQELGEVSHSLFYYLATELGALGVPLKFPAAQHYREGVFEIPNLARRMKNALSKGIVPGIPVSRWADTLEKKPHADFSSSLLICCHPRHSRADIDELVEVLSHD